jgi:hypothetical protein
MSERPRQRDPHAVKLERWLGQVRADPRIRWVDFAIAWAISCYFNRSTGIAWASVDEYAKRAHTDRRTVQRSLSRLIAAGHLSVVRGGGRKVTNQYQPILKNSGAGAALSDPGNSGIGAALSATETAAGWTQNSGRVDPNHPENSGTRAAQPLNKRPLRTTDSQRALTRASESAPSDLDPAFEEFWRQYPAKRARPAARKAFEKVVRSGRATADELVHAAMVYAAACDGREARYVASPDRWLRHERWADEEPAPAAPISTSLITLVSEAPELFRRATPDDGDDDAA